MQANSANQPKTIVVNDRSVSYIEHNPAGTVTFVLLHGLSGSNQGVVAILPHLPRVWRVIAPDLPGHGQSQPLHEAHSTDSIARHMLAFCNQLKLGNPILIGHCFGAAVALNMADCHKTTPGLILMAPMPQHSRNLTATRLFYRIGNILPTIPLKRWWLGVPLFRRFLRHRLVLQKTPENIRLVMKIGRDEVALLWPPAVIQSFLTIPTSYAKINLKTIDPPILVITAEHDILTPIKDVGQLAQALPQASLSIQHVAGTGHLLQIEEPEQVAAIMQGWVGAHSSGKLAR